MSYTGLPPCSAAIDLQQTIFSGMTQTQLQAAFTSLLNAKLQLASNAQVVTATYTQGDGQRSVTFRQADRAQLESYLMILMRALGLGGPSRRPIGIRF